MVTVVFLVFWFNRESIYPEQTVFLKGLRDLYITIFDNTFWWFYAALVFSFMVLFGLPRGTKDYNDNFHRVGFTNRMGEAPIMTAREQDAHNRQLIRMEFSSRGIPLTEWQEKKEMLEAVQNIKIDRIEAGDDSSTVVVYAARGDSNLPAKLDWDDRYLSCDGSTLTLGESLTDTVTVDLSKVPHILIGGSTGSGKSVLLKCLLMQAVRMGADVYIADFKGGVDFPRIWHSRTTILTEKGALKQALDAIVSELHRRKSLFAQHDCANLNEYNKRYGESMPRIIFACDEVAELLDKTGLDKQAREEVSAIEAQLATIARLGRAFGIHLILATQRPDANIISGQIKNNIDFRVCGRADNVLSQIILDKGDANDLIPKTAQGRFLTNTDVLFQGFWFDDAVW